MTEAGNRQVSSGVPRKVQTKNDPSSLTVCCCSSNFSYYLPKKTYHHQYKMPENPLWMTEWPLGWEGLDETGTPDPMAP